MKKAMVSVVVSCALVVSASAVTRKVPSEYPSIQLAIQNCNNGDTVLVAPGVIGEQVRHGDYPHFFKQQGESGPDPLQELDFLFYFPYEHQKLHPRLCQTRQPHASLR